MSRLEEIKQKHGYPIFPGLGGMAYVKGTDFNYLIQQSTHAEELEAEKETLMAAHQDMQREIALLKEYRDRVWELEEENINLKAVKAGNEELIRMFEQQNKRYREALEFYANRDNYKPEHFDPNLDDYMSTVDYDEGAEARKALKGESE